MTDFERILRANAHGLQIDDDPVRIVLSITATDLSEVQRHGS